MRCHHGRHGGRQGHSRRHRRDSGNIHHSTWNRLRRRRSLILRTEFVVLIFEVFILHMEWLLAVLLSLMDPTVSIRIVSIIVSYNALLVNSLCKVVRARECFIAIRTRVGSFLGVGSHMPTSQVSVSDCRYSQEAAKWIGKS